MNQFVSRPVIEHAYAVSLLKEVSLIELQTTVLIRIQPIDKKFFKPLNRVFVTEHRFHMTDTNVPGARGLPTPEQASAIADILLQAFASRAKVVVMGNRPFALSGAVMRAAGELGFETKGFEAHANRTLYSELSALLQEQAPASHQCFQNSPDAPPRVLNGANIPSMVCN